MRFTGSDEEVALRAAGHTQEFDAWRWAGIGELVGLIVPFKRAVYEQVVQRVRRPRQAAELSRPQRPGGNLAVAAAVLRDKRAQIT